jgi:hypothetical protein
MRPPLRVTRGYPLDSFVTARTRTDSEGRYVFCGLGGETSTYLFAGRGGFGAFQGTVELSGTSNTTFDIEFRR